MPDDLRRLPKVIVDGLVLLAGIIVLKACQGAFKKQQCAVEKHQNQLPWRSSLSRYPAVRLQGVGSVHG
jgi:hypothetical protein